MVGASGHNIADANLGINGEVPPIPTPVQVPVEA